ncbi:MAG: TolC family protein [Planctomycetaceae bacterium]|nr:TolC family protein [Planctomycetaceae bacterium]
MDAFFRRAWNLAGLVIVLVSLIGGSSARAQGIGFGGGGPPGGQGGGGPIESVVPRGSTRPTGVNGQVSRELDDFGGLSGGRARGGNSPGSPLLSGFSRSPGDLDEDKLGHPLGAPGSEAFRRVNAPPIPTPGGRIGPSGLVSPAPEPRSLSSIHLPGGLERQRDRAETIRQKVTHPNFDPISASSHPTPALVTSLEDPGPEDGLTLDRAIDLLIQQNLDLMALRYEITKSQADILTAGLRTNPILNASSQLVPYGEYTVERPGGSGGQPQYGVNVALPIDVSRKRRARVAVASQARRVSEAQLQNAVRSLIDNLYTAYVNVLAARESARFSADFLAGITHILEQAEDDLRRKQTDAEEAKADARNGPEVRKKAEQAVKDASRAVDALRDQAQQARFQIRRTAHALDRTRVILAQLLNLPQDQADSLQLRARLREFYPLSAPSEVLFRTALESRPDLAAYRLGLRRAEADVLLARANRIPDIYLVYQPYTLQSGRAFGVKDTYSWAVGVNVAMPVFNRNQGNIARASANVSQTQIELTSIERRVLDDVKEAIRDFQLSEEEMLELERQVLPSGRRALDDGYAQYREDPSQVSEYVDHQKDYNEVLQQYRNVLTEHRQNMLQLNTVLGVRIMP